MTERALDAINRSIREQVETTLDVVTAQDLLNLMDYSEDAVQNDDGTWDFWGYEGGYCGDPYSRPSRAIWNIKVLNWRQAL